MKLNIPRTSKKMMKTTTKNKYFLALFGIGLIGILFGYFAYANPIEFPPSYRTSAATTTSPVYLSEYSTTTSPTFDSYYITQGQTSGFNPTGAIGLTALIHMTATTGVPTLNLACEISQNGTDWFERDCYNSSTTTNIANISGEMNSYTWIFASSTCLRGGAAPLSNQSTCAKAFEIPVSTRYTRLVATMASTTGINQATGVGNADLWFELVPRKERY